MTVSFPFQPEHTFRKLGYLYFTNSLDYREVLKENPQWSVTELPPLGAQIRLSPLSETSGNPGSLTQGDFILTGASQEEELSVYPYDSEEAYNNALNRYTLQGVIDRESINGISFDSRQAITGFQ